MANAALTFVFNESVNLPIWIDYYGSQFGEENLFVVDRCSDDSSTNNLGRVNVIKVPRNEFDEDAKTDLMSSFHRGLTSCFESVVVTDCDELLVPDPQRYDGLADYIAKLEGDYVNAIGVDVIHILTQEPPLDFARPILSQRSIGRFHSPECKHLLNRKPTKWLPGLHSSDKPPVFDPDLILFHLKLMDYGTAVRRQAINLSTAWSATSLRHNYGEHHRYDLAQFVHQSFLVPIDLYNRKQVSDFVFDDQIEEIKARTVRDEKGYYRIPMDVSKMVNIPPRFSNVI